MNDDNVVINNNHGILSTLFCFSAFLYASGRISSKFIENLDTRPQKGSPAPLLGFLLSIYFCTPLPPPSRPSLLRQRSLSLHYHC